jgi:non-ribosomal peptide synthetase component E (peptide arylation enzyme)
MKIVDDEDRDLPRDGQTFGRLKVRGPSVARAYFKENANIVDAEGFSWSLKTGQSATSAELLGFLDGKVARWWMPDDVVFVEDIPHTATGKIQKTALRRRFKDYVPSSAVDCGSSPDSGKPHEKHG